MMLLQLLRTAAVADADMYMYATAACWRTAGSCCSPKPSGAPTALLKPTPIDMTKGTVTAGMSHSSSSAAAQHHTNVSEQKQYGTVQQGASEGALLRCGRQEDLAMALHHLQLEVHDMARNSACSTTAALLTNS
jgi:hypothetical protein